MGAFIPPIQRFGRSEGGYYFLARQPAADPGILGQARIGGERFPAKQPVEAIEGEGNVRRFVSHQAQRGAFSQSPQPLSPNQSKTVSGLHDQTNRAFSRRRPDINAPQFGSFGTTTPGSRSFDTA